MGLPRNSSSIAVVALSLSLSSSFARAASAGPFGNALPDEGGFGILAWFPRLLGPFIAAQIEFQRQLTSGIHAVAHDPRALWGLVMLSFSYGVLHAIGPGHGKAVVSSYVLATGQTVRNGILLSFLSSLAQAVCAIAIAFVASRLLHLTSVRIANATVTLEIIADVAILLLGVRLVWSKVLRPLMGRRQVHVRVVSSSFSAQGADVMLPASSRFQATAVADPDIDHEPDCSCGQLHLPSARLASGKLDWSKAWMVVVTTGLRPCSGALIVLAFALSQQVLGAGVLATLAMGFGTFVTVAALATLSALPRAGTFLLTRDAPIQRRSFQILEGVAALAVFVFGLLLLSGHFAIAWGWSA